MCEVGKGKERGNEPRGSKGPSLNEGSKAEDPPCSKLVRNTTEHTVDTHADNGKACPHIYVKHINCANHCKGKST